MPKEEVSPTTRGAETSGTECIGESNMSAVSCFVDRASLSSSEPQNLASQLPVEYTALFEAGSQGEMNT